MKKNLTALFLLLTFVFQSAALAQTATKPNSPAHKAAMTITAEQLKDYLYYVASDEMEGRDTPSRGLDLTAKFIALNLKRWGFKPAGDNGSFFQTIALSRDAVDGEKTSLEIGGQTFKFGEDFLRVGGDGAAANAPLVFGKNGWFVKSKNIDALAGVDVRGKTLVLYSEGFNRNVLTPFPAGVTPQDLAGEQGKDWADPMTYAKQKGAVGIILVGSPQMQSRWEQTKNALSRGGLYPDKLRTADAEKNLPVIFVSQKAAETAFPGMDMSSAAASEIGKSASLNTMSKREIVNTQNVVAVWEGSDPKLKTEMVAVGAHYDHVGTRPNAAGEDKIWNGADDDGSGTVAVLAMAEALAKSLKRPKRSILLVWHAGEEKGLWGSEYFNKFPTVDIKKVITQLNIDMIGRSRKADDANPKNKDLSGEQEVYVIGSEMMSSKLGAVTRTVNDSFLKLSYNYKYDDPKDTNRFFFRSDHFNYAVNGIPIVFWFDGVHEDYHGADDEVEKIDYPKMERISRTIFLTMWEIADLKERPIVDKQLPEELTKR
jgi:hypothetical protein